MRKVTVPLNDGDEFYGIAEGSWGILSRKHKHINWYYCRDVFDQEPLRLKEFCFWVKKENSRRVIKFIEAVQKRLKLSKRNRLKINLTNRPTVLHIRLSNWWRDRARRSLLTCLLRAGLEYDGHFWKTMGKYEYLRTTWFAVQRFFKGYTRFARRNFNGWQDTFCPEWGEIDEKSVEKALKK
jgi:hypothetical protein